MADLKVCSKCGWYDHGQLYRDGRCNPARGDAAKAAIAALDGVQSTMLGYGFGHVVFGDNIDDHDFTLEFQVACDGTFQWRDVTCFRHDLTQDQLVDLVKTLMAWRARCGPAT